MSLRDGYTEAALRYYDQRRTKLVEYHSEARVAEWESVIEEHLASSTGHLPPLEALLLMSDIFRQGEWQGELQAAQHAQWHKENDG